MLTVLQTKDFTTAANRKFYIELRAQDDADISDRLQGATSDLEHQRKKATEAKKLAETKQAEQARRTETVRAARADQSASPTTSKLPLRFADLPVARVGRPTAPSQPRSPSNRPLSPLVLPRSRPPRPPPLVVDTPQRPPKLPPNPTNAPAAVNPARCRPSRVEAQAVAVALVWGSAASAVSAEG